MGRSLRPLILVLVLAFYAAVGFGPLLPGDEGRFGELPFVLVVPVALCGVLLAGLAFRWPAVRGFVILDELWQIGAFGLVVWSSGTASTPLWALGLMRSFAWTSRTPSAVRFSRAAMIIAHLVLAVAFLWRGKPADASLVGLMLLAFVAIHTMTARTRSRTDALVRERDALAHELQEAAMNRDRDRIARELHDGLGADVTALVLRLRREASAGANPHAAVLAKRAEHVLDELRMVVWSLRSERGTVAELGKLIDAIGRRLCTSARYESIKPSADDALRAIGPEVSVAALDAARRLVGRAAQRPGVQRVGVSLSVDPHAAQLSLRVDGDGAQVESVTIPLEA